jgi:tetratricopeptide (TPR) repeat protein
MSRIRTVAVISIGVLINVMFVRAAIACPEADRLWRLGKARESASAAERCLAIQGDSAPALVALARAWAAEKRYDAALDKLRLAQKLEDKNLDIVAWRLRVLVWMSDLSRAQELTQKLPAEAYAHAEVLTLSAQVAWRSRDWPAVLERFSKLLKIEPKHPKANWYRGVALKELKREKKARQAFGHQCRMHPKDTRACDAAKVPRARALPQKDAEPRFELFVQGGYALAPDHADGWNVYSKFSGRLWRSLKLGAIFEVRARDYGNAATGGGGLLTDYYLQFFSSYLFEFGLGLRVAGGFGLDIDFVPQWSVEFEPSYKTSFGLISYLKYWRVNFETGGAHVIAPAVQYYFSHFMADLRYYLSVDDLQGVGHSGLGRFYWFITSRWTIYAGGGGGNALDYLEVRNNTSGGDPSFFTILGGLRTGLWKGHQLYVDYLYRHENTSAGSYNLHQFLLGYELRI